MACSIIPVSAFQSTNLNSKIETFYDIADRNLRNIGEPLVRVEATNDMLFEFISQAAELWTRFAGYTEEHLVFRSDIYSNTIGVRLDQLFTMASNMRNFDVGGNVMDFLDRHFVVLENMPTTFFATGELSSVFVQDLKRGDIIDVLEVSPNNFKIAQRGQAPTTIELSQDFQDIFAQYLPFDLSTGICQTDQNGKFTLQGVQLSTGTPRVNRYFDYDLMDYRKVISVKDYVEGSSAGVNTLFSIEQSLAQQTYFSYAMGNYGFDLVSWHIVQEWIETRQKVLQTRKGYLFDPRTQYFKLYPPPSAFTYAVISAYVERPMRDVVKEPWVQQYSLQLTKIAVAHARGKIQGLSLFGGGTVNYSDLMQQGIKEKEELEKRLYEGASPGLADAQPFTFIMA